MSNTKKIEAGSVITDFAADDEKTRERFEQALTELDGKLKPWTDAIRESERLSENDFVIRINTRD